MSSPVKPLNFKLKPLSRSVLMLSLGVLPLSSIMITAISTMPVYAASVSEQRFFDIKAGSLESALTQFSVQSGVTVSFTPELVNGKTSSGLQGNFSTETAIERLLVGTHLSPVLQGSGGYSLTVLSNQANLGTINIDETRYSARTENTGLYGGKTGTTALPFNASIKDTPQSVTIVSRQQIDDQKLTNLADVVENVTGLSINRYESNRGSLYARGFNITNFLIDGAHTTINEQWSAGEILNNTAMYDRVEVLRGADGLMTGIGNPSAVINLVRKRADSKDLTGSVSVEAGSWDQYGVMLDVGGALSEDGSTRARFVADYDDSNSYIDRLENTDQTFFLTLEQDIGDSTIVSAGISHQKTNTNSPTWGGVPAFTASDANSIQFADWSRSKSTAPSWSFWDTDYTTYFVKAEHDLGNGWQIKANYSRGERDSESKLALPYLYPINPATGTSYMHLDFGGFTYSYEVPGYAGRYWVDNVKDDVNIQVDGQFDLLGQTHDIAFGFDYSKERLKTDGAPGSITITSNIYEFNGDMPQPDFISPANNFLDYDVTQKAFYAATRLTLADPLKLILGSRLIDYEVDDTKAPANSYKTDDEVIPYVGLVAELTDNVSIYASYTTIFNPQNRFDASNKLLDPIEGNTKEVGLKSLFFDDRLQANLSVFKMEQENVANYVRANPDIIGQGIYEAVAGVTSEGFEAELIGELLPGWNLSMGYSQLTDTSGDTEVMSLIPRKQFKLFTSYQLPGNWQALTIGGGVRWQSKVWRHKDEVKALGVPKLEQEAYAVVDLLARYQVDDNWSVQMNLNNVFDKAYFAPTDDGLQYYWQAPRHAQLTLKYDF